MTAKHTPGPWQVRDRLEGDCPIVSNGVVRTAKVHGRPGELYANARLIAAAPDMLGALDEISRKYSNGASADTLAWIARAAIAKAEDR